MNPVYRVPVLTYYFSKYDMTLVIHHQGKKSGTTTGLLPSPIDPWFFVPLAVVPLISRKKQKIQA
ncbi:MAG: hypothetical protein D6732_26605 [Methanobacteriota archaeon]|nr:MAG: hypothetical protein D6732_26605 [Euryarchaeota archaeon]